MQDVVERRGKVRKYNTDPEYKKQVDDDKRERAKAQRKADPPVSLFDIVIPLAPFGIPGVWAVAEHLLRPMNAFRMVGVEDHLRAGEAFNY